MSRLARVPSAPMEEVVFDTTPVKQDVRRVLVTDFAEIAWAIRMLQEDYGMPPMEWVTRQMRMWSNDSQYSFIRTDNAVGLACILQEHMRFYPTVREVFSYARAGSEGEVFSLYRHWYRWAKTSQADRVEVQFIDKAPLPELKKIVSQMQGLTEGKPAMELVRYWSVEIK